MWLRLRLRWSMSMEKSKSMSSPLSWTGAWSKEVGSSMCVEGEGEDAGREGEGGVFERQTLFVSDWHPHRERDAPWNSTGTGPRFSPLPCLMDRPAPAPPQLGSQALLPTAARPPDPANEPPSEPLRFVPAPRGLTVISNSPFPGDIPPHTLPSDLPPAIST